RDRRIAAGRYRQIPRSSAPAWGRTRRKSGRSALLVFEARSINAVVLKLFQDLRTCSRILGNRSACIRDALIGFVLAGSALGSVRRSGGAALLLADGGRDLVGALLFPSLL